ncbi:WD_REPEATS_REGION domain-containing protein [Durusdinium trenchii]|uniref:WD_REPEATS_REGION domain-containing protein n=1 Tax=Durusdinium trenchii TaxID=1381693 RepID=A0ABP0JGZ4_9DINO
MADLTRYRQLWKGARELKCFDLFSRSQRLARIFARYGFSSFAYDIQSQASQDIVSQSGFYEALNAGLMLADHGLCCAASPCSLFIPISQSVHQRYDWCVNGNLRNFKVRLSNTIASNTCVLLSLILRFQPMTYLVIEQPKGSFMWKMDYFRAFFREFSAFACVLTYLGFWGLDLLKPTHLQTNLPKAKSLARKATRAAKNKFAERMRKKHERMRRAGKEPPIYYKTHVDNGTDGVQKKRFSGTKNLSRTAEYPQRFVTALFTCWAATYAATQQ